jgi:hypothetical protein
MGLLCLCMEGFTVLYFDALFLSTCALLVTEVDVQRRAYCNIHQLRSRTVGQFSSRSIKDKKDFNRKTCCGTRDQVLLLLHRVGCSNTSTCWARKNENCCRRPHPSN